MNRAIVCCGTSLTFGYYQNATPYPERLATVTGLPVVNLGVGSTRLATIIPRWESYGLPFPFDVLVAEGGTNDMGLDGALAADLWPVFQAWIEDAVAAGRRVVAVSIPPRWNSPNWDAGKETERLAFNQSLADYVAAHPAVGMVDSDSLLGSGSPRALQGPFDYGDHLHMSGDGMQVLAEAVAALL